MMRKKLALMMFAALLVAVGSFAQDKRVLSKQKMEALVKVVNKKDVRKQTNQKSSQLQIDKNRLKDVRATFVSHSKGKVALTASKKRIVSKSAIITDQPEGRQVFYSRDGIAYYNTMFGVGQAELSGAVGNVVFGDDNAVYVKDLISQAGTGVWTKGTLNGNTITFNFPQTVIEFPDYGYNLEVAKLVYDASQQWYVKAADQTVSLKYDATTGQISAQGALATGQEIIGLIYDDDESWAGYADYAIKMKQVTDQLVEAPAGLQTNVYTLTAEGYEGSLVNVGFTDTEVYVQGIDKNLPETWVKGTVNGNKVSFASGQYIGADEVAGYHQYLMAATYTQEYNPDFDEFYDSYVLTNENIEFTYDATTKTLTESNTFLINAGKEEVYYFIAFDKAKMAPFTEVAAIPATPTDVELIEGGLNYYSQGYGWGSLDFTINTSDVDGNYILPEKLTYQIYVKVNGEVKPLTTSFYDYMYQEAETMTEFPYGYSDDWDIYASGSSRSFYYYVIGPEAYGVQAIYRGAGEERRSEIAWAEVYDLGAEIQPEAATPAYPDVTIADTDKRISYGFYTGNETIASVTNNSKPETYDVAIKLSDPALVGTVIESITFPIQSISGVSDIAVFVTSQLRVENGKNVADLAVKSVAPTKAGFVTVTLDKPYLIPEGGVYVGYSLTINSVASKLNQAPIAITDKTNEGGFFLHTSDGYLKWLDVTEIYGGDALITVKVTGSAIKSDAATLLPADNQYVMTGETFTVPVTLVNHGANGIQSVDIRYAVAGYEGVVTKETKVDAFFGKTAQFELSLPAISQRGNYDLKLTVEKVNGKANEDANAQAVQTIIALNSFPKHRVLLEEYTGFWCGWCPRGFVALEKLAELYPDDYVLISYHNADELEIMDSYFFPSSVSGFPDAWMERTTELDAYYGSSSNKEFGIVDDLQKQAKEFANADIKVTPLLNAAKTKVDVTAEVTFPYDVTDCSYALEYVLIADGLKDASWQQSNYYASGSEGYPKYMDTFSKSSDSYITGLTFNDVAVLMSQIGGVEGSVPAQVVGDTPVKHTYSFNLADAVNTAGDNVIQDKANLKVAVLLVDTRTGRVVNANKAKVGDVTGVQMLDNDTKTAQTVYYDLYGRKVSKPANGMFIRTIIANGKTVSEKVLVK